MKKIVFSMLSIIILASVAIFTFTYISTKGEFMKVSHTTAGIEHFAEGDAFYLSYDLMWDGVGNPTLENVEFFMSDGVKASESNLMIEPFIVETGFGAIDEEYAESEGLTKDLQPVLNYKVEGDFSIVLRIQSKETEITNDVSTMRITYKKLGNTQYQDIPFEDGVFMDDEM